MDPTLQKKHQAMLDRLSNRHQSRNKPTQESSSASTFLSEFSESKRSIESQLSTLPSHPDPTRIKPEISASISSLEQLLAENSYFLPPYELRSLLKSVSDLKQSLDDLNSHLLPKKKFSFKNKSSSNQTLPEPKLPEPKPKPKPVIQIRDSPGFRNRANELLVNRFKGTEIGEFTLSELDSCEVRLIGTVNSLFINRLRDCRVYVGPVVGSILIEEAENCVFVLASHQIRIHYAKGSDFYLRVRSRPIIEDCGGVRFAPYCLRYQGIEEDLRAAGLDVETRDWGNVDDFKWLKAVQSPNWSILDEGERIGMVEIQGSVCENYDR